MPAATSRSSLQVARYLLSLAAGAAMPLGFSPFDFWPVPMLAVGIIFLLTRTLPVKTATMCGFLFGVGMFGAGTSWIYVSIHEFGAASPILAGLLTGLFVLGISALMIMPVFLLYSWLNQRKAGPLPPWQQALMFSGLWVLFEWVRSWLLTGFPWLLSGYALLDTPFAALAPVIGTYGLSLLLVATVCLLFALIIPAKQQRTPNIIAFFIALAGWGLSWPLNNMAWTEKNGDISFSAVQGNIPQNLKWDPDFIHTTIINYIGLSEDQWQQELIIWPENAIPLFYNRARGLMAQLDRLARQNNSTLILGMPVDDNAGSETRYFNSILSLGEGYLAADGPGRYDKQKLVPFGEYVPMESLLRGLIDFFNLPMSEFSRGDSEQTLLKAGEATIAPYICYEVVYPDFVAQMAQESGLLITISNDTWFGKSIGPVQHFQIARMRALETGRFMIRATNDGITALIDEKGGVVKTIPRFTHGVLSATAEVRTGQTPFMVYGSWPVLLLGFLMVILPLYFNIRTRRQ
ncbi:apolipoprotein N-acyltransferase [Endozoicomonas sp. GU-1]|uniref:apolipoprotein N-acyltransferase n=1 Tax=Endozoicomonas sp. GU-1 TaxID=3009078 RepID=UPI0022B44A7E|nr:apolipoprotein N-acyltransferase [Endozoicomonas sp. GU-1]WBA85713.1 apolipoprotein N-acyltransferase [Endozoicomonas sp. GU-1]